MAADDSLKPLILLDDEPVHGFSEDEDGLSLASFSDVVAGAAVGTNGPFTVGVYANWGQGKTSVLKQAKSRLEDQHGGSIVTVWFNAWQYEKEDHPIVPLVATIVRAVELKLEEWKTTKGKAKEKTVAALTTMTRALRAVAYGFSAKAKVPVPGFGEIEAGFVAKEMIDRYDKLQQKEDPLLERTLYYNAFETLESLAPRDEAGKLPYKIVVFIDDLDRCLPPQGLKLIESIKLVLSQPGFIFVLGVDSRVIEGYLAKRYRDDFGVEDYERSGVSYLDKIVQLPLPLPSHRRQFGGYIKWLLGQDALQAESNKAVHDALADLGELLAVGSGYNPRSLVRLINNLIVDARLLPGTGQKPDADRLGFCAVSRMLRQYLGADLYQFLVQSSSLCDTLSDKKKLEQLRETHRGPESRSDPLSRTDQMTRKLLQRLYESEFLMPLIETDTGQKWLTDHDARAAVNEFLVKEREEADEESKSQARIIDDAIRESLGKKSGEPITAAHRAQVKSLDLTISPITDAGLEHLRTLTRLQTLDLANTQITDAGLEHLRTLTSLQTLYLGGTQITDAGLEHLRTLTSLQKLDLTGTQVTQAGVAALRQALPNCTAR